ncbi:hypothetical protein NFI96_027979 [Prochilodus magdalenae]|nr:hypothetical protein NFI96_027979 [Prochilodus magdalenae]
MYSQTHCRCWTDRVPVCRHSCRRHLGGLDYDLCGHQQDEEDGNVAWTHERPTVCYYPGDGDLTHEYVEIETDSCFTVAGQDFGEPYVGQEHEHQGVWMESSHQTDDDGEDVPGVSHLPGSQRTNEASGWMDDCLYSCSTACPRSSNEATNQCLCVPPHCFNVRKTLVVGVEVDVLEELIYEDTEVLHTQTV